ncbi:MAG: DMT family transporter, partial [Caldilineaceae bacterium]|nr:DMT family transporter [Caldilineaceae bacterium]
MSAQQPAHPADGTSPSRLWPYLLLTLAPLFWSGNIVVSRALRADISPVALTFWRWVVALAILLPVTWPELRRSWPVIRRRWKILVLLGLLGVFLYQMLAYQALALTTALNVLLISATAPLFIALVGWLGFGERITLRLALAIALSLLGVGVVITRGDWA